MEQFLLAVFGLLVVVGLILAIREVLMWYWKINEVVGLLKRIEAALETNARPQE